MTICASDKAYVRQVYKDAASALFDLKNIGHMIPKFFEFSVIVEVQCSAKEINILKEILPVADFYEVISGVSFAFKLLRSMQNNIY